MKKTKRLHWIALILLFMVAVFRLPAQSPWDGLQRLAGTWKQSGTFLYEKWEAGTTDTLRGEAYQQLPGAEKSTTEYLRIVRQADGSIVYQATVLNQNDSATIEFPLTFFTGNSWAFENPKHDFPQRIEYWLQDGETLRATISGSEDQPIAYWYNKVPDAQAKGPVSLRGYEVFISSRNTGTVKRFNAFTGQYLDEFGKEQIGNETQEVALGPDGKLYVTSLQAKHILKFDPATGAFLGNFTSGYDLQRPTKRALRATASCTSANGAKRKKAWSASMHAPDSSTGISPARWTARSGMPGMRRATCMLPAFFPKRSGSSAQTEHRSAQLLPLAT